jgi:hypothetical protein
MKKKRFIYHIKKYRHRDGRIGKIGCTDNLKRRLKELRVKRAEILEEFVSDVIHAANREIYWQRRHGYRLDWNRYYHNWGVSQSHRSHVAAGKASVRVNRRNRTGWFAPNHLELAACAGRRAAKLKRGIHAFSAEQRGACGRRGSRTNKRQGTGAAHDPILRMKGTIASMKELRCPHCMKLGIGPVMFRHHFDNCRSKIA